MRRRIAHFNGLGNSEPELLNNKGRLKKWFSEEVLKAYFEDFGGFDYSVTKNFVRIGIEPTYQFDRLRLIEINKDIGESFIQYGKAFGYYGTNIVGKKSFYKNYKLNSKFKRFVDKNHAKLFPKSGV